jgi:hypothetical protein
MSVSLDVTVPALYEESYSRHCTEARKKGIDVVHFSHSRFGTVDCTVSVAVAATVRRIEYSTQHKGRECKD